MKVLFLGYADSPLIDFIRAGGDEVIAYTDTMQYYTPQADMIVAYGYRHIIPRWLCEEYDGRAINLHIAYLPWNRGSDPNLWSWLDGTVKGVTIHYIAPGIDTGDIIAQREVAMGPNETLRTSYDKLRTAIESLFRDQWPLIRAGRAARIKQPAGGSFHYTIDYARVIDRLTSGWDTPVAALTSQASS